MGRGVTIGIRADPRGYSGVCGSVGGHVICADTGRMDGCQAGEFLDWGMAGEGVGLLRGEGCEILAQM